MAIFEGFSSVLKDVLFALLPLILVGALAHFTVTRMSKEEVGRICVGLLISMAGLALFLQGVHVGFSEVGSAIGSTLIGSSVKWLLIPIGFWLGIVAVLAEPAVRVMTTTVDKVSAGAIPPKVLLTALAAGVGVFVALAMVRVIWGIPLGWILVPGYIVAFILVRFATPAFIGVAFDAGGVATGPVTSTFVLAVSLGAASMLPGRDPVTDGFGLVALVALAPILSLTAVGAFYNYRARHHVEDSGESSQVEDAQGQG